MNLYKTLVARQGEVSSTESHCELDVAHNVRVWGADMLFHFQWPDKWKMRTVQWRRVNSTEQEETDVQI
jgi:hypothetical protein